jgi:hypothetical protein
LCATATPPSRKNAQLPDAILQPRAGKAHLSKRCGANMEGDQGDVQRVDIDAAEKLQAEGVTAGG